MEESMKNQVKQQFSRNAEKYVTSARHAKGEDLAWLVSCARANANMNVLDIATGGGHVANALAPLVRHVTAYDLTREMLEAAERFIGGNGYTNVSYVTGDAEQLPFEDESFDLVTCRIAAHHFTDIPVFAAEALRVATPGGKLLLIDNVAPEQDRLDQFYNDIEKCRDASHVRAWKKSEWIRLLESTGFRIEMAVCFPKPFQFQDWCERAGLPQMERDALENKLLQSAEDERRFFSIHANEEGRLISFSGESVYIQAIRLE
ncbi:methyltransferase domain-containing protein [Paenibacillus dokdonensis]|uniref:Methyltransferase domain-containing protein n=1 Tax=Paenibacillus dokdonensis TaxID=2567944 RepID=A0ABU6GQN7_9BACL|nr:methyltransferase domain-containing protein [Paenibacillus dokdonensis]MEC0241452.1 methyltransferase domain-containing protein [Paenibacillus dokdonensis]